MRSPVTVYLKAPTVINIIEAPVRIVWVVHDECTS